MRVNSISGFKPSFGHISKQAVDAVREQAEGYCASSESYSINPKFRFMDSSELKTLENLTLRASVLDDSWIHYEPDKGLVVQFYKDCNPAQICRFDSDKNGDIGASLNVLESAVCTAESSEGTKIDENNKLTGIWNRDNRNINNTKHTPDRFRSVEDNKILNKIYNKVLDVQPCED